jgi:hypothetical protein
MGLVQSTLQPSVSKPLVPTDSEGLPSLSIDICKFTDESFGFLIKTTDLAKNVFIHTVSLKSLYSPIENVYTYVGKDQTILSFTKDRVSQQVYCILHRQNSSGPIICNCINIYEPIGDERIDMLARLF